MDFLFVIIHYLIWHYSQALVQFSRIYRRLVVWLFNFFSVSILVRSFFAPWRRLGETYPSNFLAFGEVLAVFVVNIIMRLVGMSARLVVILVGLLATLLAIIFYPLILGLWLLLPLIVLTLILLGLGLLFA